MKKKSPATEKPPVLRVVETTVKVFDIEQIESAIYKHTAEHEHNDMLRKLEKFKKIGTKMFQQMRHADFKMLRFQAVTELGLRQHTIENGFETSRL
jgi:hypothetical protein